MRRQEEEEEEVELEEEEDVRRIRACVRIYRYMEIRGRSPRRPPGRTGAVPDRTGAEPSIIIFPYNIHARTRILLYAPVRLLLFVLFVLLLYAYFRAA